MDWLCKSVNNRNTLTFHALLKFPGCMKFYISALDFDGERGKYNLQYLVKHLVPNTQQRFVDFTNQWKNKMRSGRHSWWYISMPGSHMTPYLLLSNFYKSEVRKHSMKWIDRNKSKLLHQVNPHFLMFFQEFNKKWPQWWILYYLL